MCELDLSHRACAECLRECIIAQYPIRRPALLAPPRASISIPGLAGRSGGYCGAHGTCGAGCGRGRRAVAVLNGRRWDWGALLNIIVLSAAGYYSAVRRRGQSRVFESGGARVRRQHSTTVDVGAKGDNNVFAPLSRGRPPSSPRIYNKPSALVLLALLYELRIAIGGNNARCDDVSPCLLARFVKR